jgi:flagellin
LSVDSGATDYNATKSIVASFTRSSSDVSVGTIDIDTSNVTLFDSDATGEGIIDKARDSGGTTGVAVSDLDISALTDSTADQTSLKEYISIVDAALTDVTTAASDLGAVKTRIGMQSDFVSNLMDAVTKGIGQLVDADMNTESTRLQALQVQQQLGVQSLSIANQSSQQILSLFKG